jgi:hypothetical protein
MEDTMIQEREFVKMRKLLPKNIRKLNELPRHQLVPVGGGGAINLQQPQGPARASLEL